MDLFTVTIAVIDADLDDPVQAAALVEIIDSYARGPGGRGTPLTASERARLAPGVREHPAMSALLAYLDGHAVGAAVCLWGFSTFAGRPCVNIHDLAVLPEYQGRGVGGELLRAVEERARGQGCCKITLEVHNSNDGAKRLYQRAGFGPWDRSTLFLTKPLIGGPG